MKTCVIDCGGGLRDIYGAGVFDCCLDNGIAFDMCIGISAGSQCTKHDRCAKRKRYSFQKSFHV